MLLTILLYLVVTTIITIRVYAEEKDVFITNPKPPIQVDLTIRGTPDIHVVNKPFKSRLPAEEYLNKNLSNSLVI